MTILLSGNFDTSQKFNPPSKIHLSPSFRALDIELGRFLHFKRLRFLFERTKNSPQIIIHLFLQQK